MESNITPVAFGNKFTPEQVVLDVLEKAKTAKHVIIVVIDENDFVDTSWSDGYITTHLGMLAWAQQRLVAHAVDKV
jgi:hypothetical protein